MRRLKAITLIELIVVMAIFGIIMVGIMNLVEPINSAAQTQKVANNQRRVQTNISTYIGENVRYAENLVIVEGGTMKNAIEAFVAAKPCDMDGNEIDFSTDAAKEKINVICFDGESAYQYGDIAGRTYSGRLLKTNNSYSAYTLSDLTDKTQYQSKCSEQGTGSLYTVFGEDYYSHSDYYLSAKLIDEDGTVVDPINNSDTDVKGAISLQLTVSSDYYYNAGSKGNSNKQLNSSDTTQTFLLLNSRVSGFVFDMSGGSLDPESSAKKTTASADRISHGSGDSYIYFVYCGGEPNGKYPFVTVPEVNPDSPRDSGHVKWDNVADGVRLNYEAQRAGVVGTAIDAKTSEFAYNKGGVGHAFILTIKHNDDGTYTVSGALSFTGNSEDAQNKVNDFFKEKVGDLGMNYVTLS